MFTSLLLVGLASLASGQDWAAGGSGDAGFDSYLRLWRRNGCGYDSQAQRQRSEGDRWEVGVVRYECRGGSRVAVECQEPESGRWMRPGEAPAITRDGAFGRTCVLDSDGYMRLATSHCAANGRPVGHGETFEDAERKYWFRCVENGPFQVRTEIGGCITDAGIRLAVGESIDIQATQTWYKCSRKESQAVAFCTQGCLDNGRRRNTGERWSEAGREYECRRMNGRCEKVEISAQADPQPRREETYASSDGAMAGYCPFREGSRLRFYLPHNSYTQTASEEYQRDVYVVCEWNAWANAYEAKKYELDRYEEVVAKPGIVWATDIRYQ